MGDVSSEAVNLRDGLVNSDGTVGGSEAPGLDPRQNGGAGQGKPRSLVRLTAVFASGNLLATALRLVSGVLVSRVVDPSVLGLFNGIGLVQGYAPFLQGGVANGLNRELPYRIGKGEEEKVQDLASASQAWILIVGVIAVIGLLGVAGWHGFHGRFELALGWASFTVPVFGILFGEFYLRVLYVTHGRFHRLSFITVATAAVGVATVALVWWLGFEGLCLRGFLLGAVMLALLWQWRPLVVRPRWRWPDFKLLVFTGMPIFLVGQLGAWWPVLNSTMVLGHAGTRGLGLFAIANMAGPTVAMLPRALSQVVYPRMSEQYGRTGRIRDLTQLVAVPTFITFGFTLLAVLVAWFATPPVVALILPEYVEGTSAAQWSVAATLVLALTPVNNVFNVAKKQGRYASAMVTGMGAYFVTLKWLIRDEVRLEAFPQAMIVGRIVFVLGCLLLIWHLVWTESVAGDRPEK